MSMHLHKILIALIGILVLPLQASALSASYIESYEATSPDAPFYAIDLIESSLWAVGGEYVRAELDTDGSLVAQSYSASSTLAYTGVAGLSDGYLLADTAGYVTRMNDGALNTLSSAALRDVEAYSDERIYVVGDEGYAGVSTDGGDSWSQLTMGFWSIDPIDLNAVHVGADNVWAVGDDGYIIQEEEGVFLLVDNTAGVDLYGVAFDDSAQTGWVVGEGGMIVTTSDAGETWEQMSHEEITADLYGVLLLSESIYVYGDDLLAVSTDDGTTWDVTDLRGSSWVLDGELAYTLYDAVADESSGQVWFAGSTTTGPLVISNDIEQPSAPGNIVITSGTPTDDTTPSFSWVDATDNSGAIDHYEVAFDSGDAVSIGDEAAYTATEALGEGDHTISVWAVDAAGNMSEAATKNFTIQGAEDSEEVTEDASSEEEVVEEEPEISEEEELAVKSADPGTLIKLPCAGSTDVNDPCRAVYYYADDGKRHAFPNSKVFFTWYEDFDDVVIVDSDFMSSLMLGSNVTYHPGTKMVKFQSWNTVYTVSAGGVLRAVASEEMAIDLYGDDWNTQIDDISDAFFSNYSFGDDLVGSDDYNVEEHRASVSSIDDDIAARD